jgi:glycosyltransferase involved in cell wall biosynthesis
MKLRLIGQRNHLGLGTHFSNTVDALKRLLYVRDWVEEVDGFDQDQFASAVQSSRDSDVNIWFWPDQRISMMKGSHVVWAIFESDRLPRDFVDFLNRHALVIWVPTHWGRDTLLANGAPAERVDVVPEGVDPDMFHGHVRRVVSRSGQPFRFLAVGKLEKRKAYPELLEAFGQAFGNDTTVELVLKADDLQHIELHERKKRQLTGLVALSGMTNVKLQWGNWPRERMAGLYNYCDAFVFPSRAEGWGLPALEAIATGLPIVSTLYSGHTEFLQDVRGSVLEVEFALEPIDDPEYLKSWPADAANRGSWAQPSITSLATCLKAVRRSYSSYGDAAAVNGSLVREKFSWSAAANKAMDSLIRRGLIRLELK